MAKVYHNTTNLSGTVLESATEKAVTLKELIHDLFKQMPGKKTPFDVSVILVKNGYKYPITSIRARMTSLTKDDKYLAMSSAASAMGIYNAPNHTWELSEHQDNKLPPEIIFKNM